MYAKIELIKTDPYSTIIQNLKKMDEIRRKLLIVIENGKYLGLLSIGDIQRAIINNSDLNFPIISIMRNDYMIASPTDSIDQIKRRMLQIRSEFMPVIDGNGNIIQLYFWEDLFGENKIGPSSMINLPIVIMAGGFGTRLRPLTSVLPKPLIPIGDKTMLEEIFDRFSNYGCKDFFISVNYKADLIKYYIQNQKLPFNIEYLEEDKPTGTAGSLSMLKTKINSTFFVTNCDILIEQDYSEILDYHRENNNEITIVAALKHYPISYGTIETCENGKLVQLIEKPELTFKINSGMYILEPHLINEIPKDQLFHITHLIEQIKERQGKIGVFPVSEGSWNDIGNWDEYFKFIKK